MSVESQILEGMKEMDLGEKCLNKTSFFGSKKPDYDSASIHFQQAATLFKVTNSHCQCLEAYVKLSTCHVSLSSLFMAAKAMEQAASVASVNLNNKKGACEYWRKACDLYNANGSTDKAIDCLEKCAKDMESIDLNTAISQYIYAFDICDTSKPHTTINVYKRGIFLCLRNNQYDHAQRITASLLDLLLSTDGKVQTTTYKLLLSSIILSLVNGDEVDAMKKMDMHVQGWAESEEFKIAAMILDAVENGDAQGLSAAVKHRSVTYLDNEFAKLAMKLKIHTGMRENTEATIQGDRVEVSNIQDEIEEEGFC